MLNTTALKNAEQNNVDFAKQIKDKAVFIFVAVAALSWYGVIGEGISDLLLGSVLVGLNLVRRHHGIAMSKASFMIGALLLSFGLLANATLHNPIWLPILGLMIAANGLYAHLDRA